MAKRKKISKIISGLFVLLLMVAVVGFVSMQFNGAAGSEMQVFFRGEQLINDSAATLVWGSENKFEVKNTAFGFLPKPTDYTVSVVRNSKIDFDFERDGAFERFSNIDNFTAAFSIEYDGDSFIIKIPRDFSMDDILNKMYSGSVISGLPDINFYEKDYFILRVVSDSNSLDLILRKHFILTLDKDGILF